MQPETYLSDDGTLIAICYGLCDCNVWPLGYVAYMPYNSEANSYGKCGRCFKRPKPLDPYVFSKSEAIEVYKELHSKEPWCEEIRLNGARS